MEKRLIIGIGIFLFLSYLVWYVYSNYISTKKNYEKIFDKYFTQKYVDDTDYNTNTVSRQMIENLLPITKYKLKFCDNKDALVDSPIDSIMNALRYILFTKYSEDFDDYELASIVAIREWSTFISTSRSYKSEQKPETKENLKKYEDKTKFFDYTKKYIENLKESAKTNNEYLSKEDALKSIRDIDKLC
jgi:hypothetical protein